MELIIFFGFFVSCLIAAILWILLKNHLKYLIIFYSVLILLFVIWLVLQYFSTSQFNSLSSAFENPSNSVSFTFMPKKTGIYSIDLSFLNKVINKKYESCGFPWENYLKENIAKCQNALIYRDINLKVNGQSFYLKPRPNLELDYGYRNHAVRGPSLRLLKFSGTLKTPVEIYVQITATSSELQSSEPVITVGPDEEYFETNFIALVWFFILGLPFIFSIICFLCKYFLYKART